MRKALIPAFLLLLGSAVLGATVLREPIARAAAPISSVFVTNDASHAVPVHEQGTANVNVTNAGGRVIPVAHDVTLPTGTYLSPVVATGDCKRLVIYSYVNDSGAGYSLFLDARATAHSPP